MISSFEEIYERFLDFKADRWVRRPVLIKTIRINQDCQSEIWKTEWNNQYYFRIDERWLYQDENGRSATNAKITCDKVDSTGWRFLDLDQWVAWTNLKDVGWHWWTPMHKITFIKEDDWKIKVDRWTWNSQPREPVKAMKRLRKDRIAQEPIQPIESLLKGQKEANLRVTIFSWREQTV